MTGTAPCSSGRFSYTFDVSSLADGVVTLATTNGDTGVDISRSFVKQTSYCQGAALSNSPFAGGTGSAADPHTLCTLAQFQQIPTSLTSKFQLKNNIDLTSLGSWTGPALAREFDGDNFQLKNRSFTGAGSGGEALFAVASSVPVWIRNLHLFNFSLTNNVNSQFGFLLNSYTGTSLRLTNISAHGSITTASGTQVGSLVGSIDGNHMASSYGKFSDLIFSVQLTSTGVSNVGGIAGYLSAPTERVKFFGHVTGEATVGGIIGRLQGTASRFSNWGTVENTRVQNDGLTGGLVGVMEPDGGLSNSYNAGPLRGYGSLSGLTNESYDLSLSLSYGLLDHATDPSLVWGTTENSYGDNSVFWNSDTTTTSQSGGGTELTSAQMRVASNLSPLDFTTVWAYQQELSEFPTLRWETNPSPPSITQIADQTINESTSIGPLSLTIGDATTPAAQLSLSARTSDTSIIPVSGIVFGGSGANRTVSLTPKALRVGTVTVEIEVSDGSLVAHSVFVVTINNVTDDAPVVYGGPTTFTRNEDQNGNIYPFEVYDDLTAVGSLTITATSNNQTLLPNGSITITGSGSNRGINAVFASNLSGSVIVTLTVNDGGQANVIPLNITVAPVNDLPVISGISAGINDISEDATYGPDAFTVSDVETAATSLTISNITSSNWTVVNPVNVTISGTDGNRSISVTPNANATGLTIITFRVNDGTGYATGVLLLRYNAVNDAPTISDIANQTITEDSNTGALAVTIGDLETAVGSLSVSATSNNQTLLPNANLVIGGSGASRTITATPAANQNGTATVTVTVSDGALSTQDTFDVTVTAVNDPPTISSISDQSIATNSWSGQIGFTIGDLETASSSLTVSRASSNLTLIPLSGISLTGTGSSRFVSIIPVSNQSGTATITVSVSDGTVTAQETFDVTVSAPTMQSSVAFTYPFKDGLRVGESDAGAYTIEGTCSNNGVPVNLRVANEGVYGVATCAGGVWSHTFDFSSLQDGLFTLETTNATTSASLKLVKDTAYCTTGRKAAAPFAGGDGTPWYPFAICTATQFRQISTDNDAHFELRNNIDLSSLATGEGSLYGTFNGNNFQVKNYSSSSESLFYAVIDGGKVANFHARNFTVGQAGASESLLFREISNGGSLDNVSATGTVTGQEIFGGLVSVILSGGRIQNSYVNANLTSSSHTIGGFVGHADTGARLYRNQSHSTVNAGNMATGGFTGALGDTSSIIESFAKGTVSVAAGGNRGAFVGISNGEVSDSYSTSSISAPSGTNTWEIGTFIGAIGAAGALTQNTFSTGLLTHGDTVTDRGGTDDTPGTLTNSYFNSTTTGQTSGPTGNTALSAAQFTSSGNFTGFDFTNVWAMQADRPKLKWEQPDVVAPTAPTFVFPNANGYPVGYTDINTIGNYEIEGRCSESQWPVLLTIEKPVGGNQEEGNEILVSCGMDGFWSYEFDISNIDQVDGGLINITAAQRDGAGNLSTLATRSLTVTLPSACVSNRAGTPFAGGAGTLGSPYILCTEAHLDAIQTGTTWNQTNVHFQLGDSIDLVGAYSLVNLSSRTGSFNGQNFRVLNGSVSSSSANTHWLSADAATMTTQNLHLFNFSMTSSADQLSPFNITATSSNLSFRGTLNGASFVGGIESEFTNGNLSNGYVRANITGSGSHVGGAIGFSRLNGSSFSSFLIRSGTITGADHVGGFVGATGTTFNATIGFSDVQVFTSKVSATTAGPVGGLLGYANGGSEGITISGCSVKALAITGPTEVGGLIGKDNSVGGAAISVALSSIEVENVEATAVSGIASGLMAVSSVDGNEFIKNRIVVGRIRGRSDTSGLTSSMPNGGYFSGNFSTAYLTTDSGSVYGMRSGGTGDYTNTNNYYDSRTAGTSSSVVGTAKAAHEMYRQSTYTGFDFTAGTGDWKMPKNGGYPLLQWQYD